MDEGEEMGEVAEVEAVDCVIELVWTSTTSVVEMVTVWLVGGVSTGALGVGIAVVLGVSRAAGVFTSEVVDVLMTTPGVLVSELILATAAELVKTVD